MCVSAENEIIQGDTIFIDNDEIYMSATPHTLYESGNVTFTVRTKEFNGNIDLIWGFNKATAKIKSIKHENENKKEMEKPQNKIVNKKHLMYMDERKHINRNSEIEMIVWIDIDDLTEGKYDFIVKPSSLTIDEAKELNQLYILDPWWDSSFHYKSIVCMDSTDNFYNIDDCQVAINFSYNSNMQSDFDDIRFMDADDGALLPYWIEDFNSSNWCKVWVRIPMLWGQIWNNHTVELYYGNVGASNLSDINDTFISAHGYSDTSFAHSNISDVCTVEARIYVPNSASYSYVGIENNQGSKDAVYFELSNAEVMKGSAYDEGTGTTTTEVGSYNTLATYKFRNNGNYIRYYVNNTELISINTNVPDEIMGLYYDTVASGYCEWAFIRKFIEHTPTTLIKDESNLYLKHNPDAYNMNTVYEDGTTTSSSGDAIDWRAKGYNHNAYVVINEYNNGSGEFQVSGDYSIIDFTVSNLDPDSYVTLYKEETFTVTEVVNSAGECSFDEILAPGFYFVNVKSYDNITGVHGFIYEGTSGSTIPLSETVVYIYNDTWSDTTTSDIGGYYYFSNLTNTTYTLNFKKDRYEEVLYQYVTPANLSMYYKNIYMQKSSGDYYSRHYCTFILKNIYGVKFEKVATTVYNNGDIETSGTTGYDGSVVFHLFEDVEYRITFINATQNIDEEIYISPRDDRYIIWVGSYSLNPENDTRLEHVTYYWYENQIDLAHTWLNFTYVDDESKTTSIEYWINDTDGIIIYYTSQINPCAGGDYTANFIVNSSNNSYVVHFSAIHPDYPGLENSVIQTFSYYHGKLIDLFFSENWQYTVVSLFLIIILGSLFGATNAAQGSLIMVLCAWFFSFIGWLPSSIIGYGAIVLATLLSVGWNLRKSESVHT
jgi:hypothetical protein